MRDRISLKPNKHPGYDVFINITSIHREREKGRGAGSEGKWLWTTEGEQIIVLCAYSKTPVYY